MGSHSESLSKQSNMQAEFCQLKTPIMQARLYQELTRFLRASSNSVILSDGTSCPTHEGFESIF